MTGVGELEYHFTIQALIIYWKVFEIHREFCRLAFGLYATFYVTQQINNTVSKY